MTEADWVDGALPNHPATQSGHKIQWQVWTAEKFGASTWLDVSPTDNWTIETSLAHGQKEDVVLSHGEDSWTIDFKTLSQVNMKTLTRRAIRRIVILAEASVQQ